MRLVGYLLTSLSVALGALAALQVAMSIGIPISAGLRQVTDWLVTADASRWQLGLGTMASSLLARVSSGRTPGVGSAAGRAGGDAGGCGGGAGTQRPCRARAQRARRYFMPGRYFEVMTPVAWYEVSTQ